MAAAKSILRVFIVMALVLGAGFFGLWILNENDLKVVNNGALTDSKLQNTSADQFSNIGGATPQETLDLLIKSLEKNDLTAAVQYFIPENRGVESEDLTKLYNANILSDLIKDLKSIKEGRAVNNNLYRFKIADLEIELEKNANGIWKVISL
ncbi:MAG: hypothetical protein UV53_C0002G0028 [Candidatus Azambacteria bacterium GW2011_GWE1_42_9]|nr:MAG: hypothetical protein UU33_C0001G0075 [Candidatus Azambacteria bacterium GW2011_GWF1_41_10]KKS49152.1 MAG: hypothetical protein UV14_C0002G0149 [Candidatus Azambacteria bacterium GW2011_GWF2_42_22]KKS79722.1 MAG: hypothetical protein UV53_C0002G0028 [Candidatus Azambacteria bacterium GW2011_GWE1_42_9]KKT03269.1 MAG: hypothetical protein UV81_C0002G0022 [Candidatus Azambacteria bacterium GW2011_GWD1_43_18]KKT12654.1 MAG: hypothetical protein UV93_C0002G0052 [Candidatus Azambacteria bacter